MTRSCKTWRILINTNDHRQGYDYTGILQATEYLACERRRISGSRLSRLRSQATEYHVEIID